MDRTTRLADTPTRNSPVSSLFQAKRCGSSISRHASTSQARRVASSASRIGDDFIQSNLGSGRVNSSQFTHGSSQQREKWFTTGYQSGDLNQCDTFSVANVE